MSERPADTSEAVNGRARDSGPPFRRLLVELLILVALAVVLALGLKAFVVQPFSIPSSSMSPTLEVGDRVLVNRFIYRFRQPRQGDIVVLTSPDEVAMDLIKRVIAVGGQTVEVSDGIVYVDGHALDEPYVNRQARDFSNYGPVKIPPGYVWLMGDNRTNSRDSRIFGPQPVSHLLGEAFLIYWPLSRSRAL